VPQQPLDLWLGPYQASTFDQVADVVVGLAGVGRTVVIVDGQSGSGKTTFATRLAQHIDGAALVSTDDVAWHLSLVDWDQAVLDHVITPWLAGDDIDYRPPGWITKGREGSVTARGTGILVLEGVGAGRRRLADHASCVLWVDASAATSRERCLSRDLGINGDTLEEVEEFYQMYTDVETPPFLAETPWERAALIVDGETGFDGPVMIRRVESP